MSAPGKVVDLIINKELSFSFEVSPGVSVSDIDNLEVEPTFFSVTWHAKSHECRSLDIPPLQLARDLNARGKEVLLHLSCDLLKKDFLDSVLKLLQDINIRNLFVVLGERYDENQSEFKSTQELIRYIRQTTSDYFCIAVAGFTSDSEERLQRLKEKVQSGAEVILTQAIFSADEYKRFLDNCHKLGINVPVLAGLFVFETCEQLVSFTNMCKVDATGFIDSIKNKTSSEILDALKTLAVEVKNIQETRMNNTCIHIFTLNQLNRACKFVKTLQ